MRKIYLHNADVKLLICDLQTEPFVSNTLELNVVEILDRIKVALSLRTDSELATHLDVSNKTISSWRTRNSIPIESVLQVVHESGQPIDFLLLGTDRKLKPKLDELLKFNELNVRDFELAGETILASVLEQFAGEELSFMSEEKLRENGERLGTAIMSILSLVRQERKALFDTGKLGEPDFENYVRKAFRTDLPYVFKAIQNRSKKKGPQ